MRKRDQERGTRAVRKKNKLQSIQGLCGACLCSEGEWRIPGKTRGTEVPFHPAILVLTSLSICQNLLPVHPILGRAIGVLWNPLCALSRLFATVADILLPN